MVMIIIIKTNLLTHKNKDQKNEAEEEGAGEII